MWDPDKLFTVKDTSDSEIWVGWHTYRKIASRNMGDTQYTVIRVISMVNFILSEIIGFCSVQNLAIAP